MPMNQLSKRRQRSVSLFALALLVYVCLPFVKPVAMGAILGVVLLPVFQALRNKNFSERWSALLVTLGISLVVLIPTTLFIYFGAQTALTQVKVLRSRGSLSSEDSVLVQLMN